MSQISIDEVVKSAPAATWLQRFIDTADKLKLRASAWQPGSIARGVFQTFSYAFALGDSIVSGIAQGGFLDFAATGSVTYTDAAGVTTTSPVTPEGGPGWLDILTDGQYDTQRIESSSAGGRQAFVNTSASTYGPIAAGTLHVSNSATKIQYSSTESATIPPSPIVGTSVVGVSNYFGQVKVVTSTNHGLATGAVVAVLGVLGVPPLASGWVGTVTVIDVKTIALDGTTMAGAYVSGGVVRTPTVATVTADVEGSIGSSLDGSGVPNTNSVTTLVTNLIGVTTGNVDVFFGTDQERNLDLAARARLKLASLSPNGPKGAYEYFTLSASQWAAKLTPPLKLGAAITREREFADPNDGTVFVVVANPVGASSPADVAVVDAVLQAFSTPNAVTSKVISATDRNVSCAVTVWLPAAFVNDATRELFQVAIQDYFRTLPIGGDSDPQGSYQNVVPIEGVAGAVFIAANGLKIKVQNVGVILNNAAQNLQLVVNLPILRADIALLAPAVPTVSLVAVKS